LLRKNYQVLKRQWASSLYFILGPIIFILLLLIPSTIVNNNDSVIASRYDPVTLQTGKCVSLDVFGNVYNRAGYPCVSIIYAPNYDPYQSIMTDVMNTLGWTTSDVQGFDTTSIMVHY
jgi:hypothetical protein